MKVNSVVNPDGTVLAENQAGKTSASDASFSNYIDKASLSYGDYLEQIFQKASDTYQVSKDLLKAMAKAESNFKADITSSAGAMGIMQLMPGTATSLGVTDAFDPEQNIMGGAKYISRLLEKYNGNLSYAVAAYNAGSGNVDRYGGIPPFTETQNYVAKVLQYMKEGVTIPNSSGSSAAAGNSTNAAAPASQTDTKEVSSGSALQNVMDKYFDYDDYLEFLQLFTKIIYEKLTGETVEEPAASASEDEETERQVQQPVKRLTMKVRDADGHVATYRQGDSSQNEVYTAYQNMAAGAKNRMAVFLNRTADEA